MTWIQTPDGVVVNEDAIAEILPPRVLGSEYTVEITMLNGDPSRKDKRELCRGTKEECEAFLDDLKSNLEIIPKPKPKPKTKASTSRSKSTKKEGAEAETPDEPTENAE